MYTVAYQYNTHLLSCTPTAALTQHQLAPELGSSSPLPTQIAPAGYQTLDTELAAIHLALKELYKSNVIIITDSLNATKEIACLNTRHTLAGEVQIIISTRHRAHLNPVLLWVPSHIGPAGKDRADCVTLAGATQADVEIVIHPSITKLTAVSRATTNLWECAIHSEHVWSLYLIRWLWSE